MSTIKIKDKNIPHGIHCIESDIHANSETQFCTIDVFYCPIEETAYILEVNNLLTANMNDAFLLEVEKVITKYFDNYERP